MAPPAPPSSSSVAPGDTVDGALKHSPLEDAHRALGAKLVGFGGWLMPLSYEAGTVAEHMACRRRAVAFDVSHLGTVRVEGAGSTALLQRELSNDLRKVAPGRAQYTHLLDEVDGSVLDDIIVWWRAEDAFDVMPNASNTDRVRGALGGTDVTATRAVVAIQGPDARQLLTPVAPEAAAVARFAVTSFEWSGHTCTAAGTGYTGEDGVECAVPLAAASAFWRAVMDAGIAPAGLGARDTLRLEAGLPLHGHELGAGITPLDVGLEWVVGWAKDDFRGRDALERRRAAGPGRTLRGLEVEGRQPPRAESDVVVGSSVVGTVTSGNFSPVLERGIALAFVDHGVDDHVALAIDVRGRHLPARTVPLPFVAGGGRGAAVGERP